MEDLDQSRDTQNSAVKTGPEAAFTSYPELTDQTCKNLVTKGIKTLFPIQQECFYPIFERKDVIARDLTGSGKTLAFALPTIEFLRSKRLLGSRNVQAIVLAPTRELAI
jgi:ATP-dependent RNA helicase DDX21